MANRVTVYGLSRRSRLERQVASIAQAVLRHFHIQSKLLEVIFLGDEDMVALKRRYLKKKSGPANTLSFAAGDSFPKLKNVPVPLGEVFINTDLTEYQIDKISPLLIHSILHLLGYHHDDERDKIEMDRLAREVARVLKK